MTEIQAALGYSQMDRIDSFIKKRHEIASVYDSKLSNLPLKLPYRDVNNFSSLHLYVIRLQIDNKDIDHKFIFESLRIMELCKSPLYSRSLSSLLYES